MSLSELQEKKPRHLIHLETLIIIKIEDKCPLRIEWTNDSIPNTRPKTTQSNKQIVKYRQTFAAQAANAVFKSNNGNNTRDNVDYKSVCLSLSEIFQTDCLRPSKVRKKEIFRRSQRSLERSKCGYVMLLFCKTAK